MEPIGKATFIGDDDILYYDAETFLDCIRAELPYRDTTGFRYEVLTDDPAVRKAADDILLDFFGEDDPCCLCASILVRLINSLCAAVGLCFACLGRGGKEQTMEEKKNLCAPIPLSLHQRLRAEQEQRGQTLADYITDILREHFEGGARTMNANNRTIAFQVPEELFGRLKDYLARNGLKQKDFILGLIERELNDAGNEE